MGICESNNNRNTKVEPNQNIESIRKNKIIEECIIKKPDFLESLLFLDTLYFFEKMESSSNVAKSICKLILENIIGTEFLLAIDIEQEFFFFNF